MRQVWLIAWRGFVAHATSRAFLIGLMLLPVYMIVGGALPTVSQSQLSTLTGDVRHFAVIDKTGVMLSAIDAALERDVAVRGLATLSKYAEDNADTDALRNKDPQLAELLLDSNPQTIGATAALDHLGGVSGAFLKLQPYLKPGSRSFNAPGRRFYRVAVPDELVKVDDAALVEATKPYLFGDILVPGPFRTAQLWAVLVIPKGFVNGGEPARYISDDLTRAGLKEFLRDALDGELRRLRATALDIPGDHVDDVLATAGPIQEIDPDPALHAVTGARQLAIVGAIIIYLMLFMAVFMTANMVVMALVEEKSNRVAELLLSCVRAETLMAGKLFTGLMLAAFLVGVWLTTAYLSVDLLFPTTKVIVLNLVASFTSPTQILQVFVFFALAYLTIGSFFLAAGSAATSITDAQAIVAPATMVTMPIFMLPIAIAYAPDSGLARVASYLPFFAPFTMMVRSMGEPDGIDILAALVVSILTLWWMVRLVARVFRANLLRPDSTTSFLGFLRDLFRAPKHT
jgi:ABC-2 type transport system permease protein